MFTLFITYWKHAILGRAVVSGPILFNNFHFCSMPTADVTLLMQYWLHILELHSLICYKVLGQVQTLVYVFNWFLILRQRSAKHIIPYLSIPWTINQLKVVIPFAYYSNNGKGDHIYCTELGVRLISLIHCGLNFIVKLHVSEDMTLLNNEKTQVLIHITICF